MDGCSKNEMERIQEYQRKMYEEKLKHLKMPHWMQNVQSPPLLSVLNTASSSASANQITSANTGGRSKSRPNNKTPNLKPPTSTPKAKAEMSKKSKTTGPTKSDPNSSSKKSDRNEKEGVNCPTCKKLYSMYVYQCSEGHSSCKQCKIRSANCGLCSKPITEKRNFTLETYLAEKIVACPNTVDGCWMYFKLVDMEAHLKECPFGELRCPVEACAWRGKLPILSLHFDDAHPEYRQGTTDTKMLIPIKSNTTTMHLVEIGPFNFLIRLKIDEKSNIYMVAQLFGTCVSASKWNYKFQISNGTRMYEYSDVCLSNNVTIEEIYKDAKCAMLAADLALNFVTEDCLAYKFFLQKDTPKFGCNGAARNKNLEYKTTAKVN